MKYSVCVWFSNVHVVWMICPVSGYSTCIVYIVSAVQKFFPGGRGAGERIAICVASVVAEGKNFAM